MSAIHQPAPPPPSAIAVWVAAHRKLLAAIAGGLITVLVTIYGTDAAWVQALILAGTAAGVYGVPNAKPAPAPAGKAAS